MRDWLPLNALRAFESSARHLNFTRAARELNVTQAAVSQQVRMLEERLSIRLFKRLPRGLDLTDEGLALLPVLTESFDRIESVLQQFDGGHFHEALTVAAVGTFAVGWLIPRLGEFHRKHPFIDLRVMTHNNVINLAAEGLDFAICFGDGAWPATRSVKLLDAPLTALCPPQLAARLTTPASLRHQRLLRSYRRDEWDRWLAAAGVTPWRINGPVFDSSQLMVEAAIYGGGVALAPAAMFSQALQEARLVRPFDVEVNLGAYWLTSLKSRAMTPAMKAFEHWLLQESADRG
ncbi:LysR family transcriptional regulator [Serratia sp. AKBS12]|uniref:LysR family transcriptional regulator n=1 Tax=Serratia sp. AKBS12 TaxID=2974597 RepID=UPI0021652771|nr:LysR family transcriptional regulator [Serratia sp. AKBS12]MCS3408303.1 LysR family transcriptional regulator [Serratia sp. AKBS12]HEI8864642.1 LysR family transcriptional regulator [Serratia odorifera]HEI8869142.1 LysR family transcriptional regulator [Serratia odorifera]